MKVALAHHRFAWIHPFTNGNGRVVRLLTHAMLLKYGFQVTAAGRLLNPAAVFCADRNRYYAMLGQADSGSEDLLEQWCTYVLQGIRDELQKVSRLARYDYLRDRVLLPAISHARQRQQVSPQEEAVLRQAALLGTVKSADLEAALPGLNGNQRTYQIRKLLEAGMLQPVREGARQYALGFTHNVLLRGVVRALGDEGFIPAELAAPSLAAS
jgi:Fic family protein